MTALKPIAKALVPLVLALLTALGQALIAGHLDTTTLIVAGLGVLGAPATYLVPNRPPAAGPPGLLPTK